MHIERIIQMKPEEEILQVVHEDVLARVPVFILLFLWFLVPFFFLFPLFRLGWIGVVIFLALLASALVVGWRSVLRWTRTMLVVTDKRVIDIEQRGLFDRIVTEAPYSHVDEVSYRVKGMIPTMFGYGDINIKLSGSAADIAFRRVHRPSKLQDLVNDLCEQARHDDKDSREKKFRQLTSKLTPEEMNAMIGQVRKRERDEAISQVFSKD
jgi:hypothetical protein